MNPEWISQLDHLFLHVTAEPNPDQDHVTDIVMWLLTTEENAISLEHAGYLILALAAKTGRLMRDQTPPSENTQVYEMNIPDEMPTAFKHAAQLASSMANGGVEASAQITEAHLKHADSISDPTPIIDILSAQLSALSNIIHTQVPVTVSTESLDDVVSDEATE